jgi:hypothetical protein
LPFIVLLVVGTCGVFHQAAVCWQHCLFRHCFKVCLQVGHTTLIKNSQNAKTAKVQNGKTS